MSDRVCVECGHDFGGWQTFGWKPRNRSAAKTCSLQCARQRKSRLQLLRRSSSRNGEAKHQPLICLRGEESCPEAPS